MADYNLWVNDLNHRYSPTSLTYSNGIATAIISSVTTNSSFRASEWDAYFHLRCKLMGLSESDCMAVFPKSTTTEASALTTVEDGVIILNTTLGVLQVCNSSAFQSSAGVGMMLASAFGDMYENNTTGSAIGSTFKTWITAGSGVFDSNSNVTFVNDDTNGDYLLVGDDGAGTYDINAFCSQTNSGSNKTTMVVQVNAVDTNISSNERNSSSSNHRPSVAFGFITLAAADKVRLKVYSSTLANTITVYNIRLKIKRID